MKKYQARKISREIKIKNYQIHIAVLSYLEKENFYYSFYGLQSKVHDLKQDEQTLKEYLSMDAYFKFVDFMKYMRYRDKRKKSDFFYFFKVKRTLDKKYRLFKKDKNDEIYNIYYNSIMQQI